MKFSTIVIRCYLLRIFSDQKDFVRLFLLNLILNFFDNTRILNIRMHSVIICSAYACKKTSYKSHGVYSYADHMHVRCMQMLSIHIQSACLCSVYGCRVHSYVQHAHAQCKSILSIRMSTPEHFEPALTLF